MMVHAYNPRTLEAEAGELAQFSGQLGLCPPLI